MRLRKVRLSRVWGLVVVGLVMALASPAWAKHNKKKAAEAKKQAKKDADSSSSSDDQSKSADQADGADQDATQQKGPSLRRGNRMEFDARLIRGEAAGSGAVFLFERAQRPLPSLISKRKSFLHGTVDSELGRRWAKKFDDAQKKESDSQ